MRFAWLAVAAVLTAAPAAASDALVMPDPVYLPRPVDTPRLAGAIIAAATRRKWLVEADTGEAIIMSLQPRHHVLRIRVEYRPTSILFAYMDSRELDYEIDDGVPYIHYKANRWLAALGQEVRRQLQTVIYERELATVVPVEEASPAAAPSAAAAPAAPAAPAAAPPAADGPLKAGGMAVLRAVVPLRPRPMADAEPTMVLGAGLTVQLVSVMRNVGGVWWYVTTGPQSGWVPEKALRPPAAPAP